METTVSKIKERIIGMRERDRILIAIDGSCTAGKSTLASMLARELDYEQEETVQQDVPNGKVSDMIIPIVALIIITNTISRKVGETSLF